MEATERKILARLIRGGRWAALATVGDGAPLASMVAYACEPGFAGFLLHLSRLSEHTRNLLATPSASIAISEPDTAKVDNPQTLARISIQGEVRPLPKQSPGYAEAKALYEKRFPESSPLFGFEDFLLFRLLPKESRFVAGFARAYTVSGEELKEAAAEG
ncbi:MAG: HugZ family protein [Actinomycetota bacterium]